MAKPILVANWKNHPESLSEAQSLLRDFSRQALLYKKLSFYIAAPLTYFESVSSRATRFASLASQSMSEVQSGTHTGEVTNDILKNFGVRLSIIGHSEQRALGETSEQVATKASMAYKAGITPLICIGERARDHDGEYFEFLRTQIKASFSTLNAKTVSKAILAYEPVWAIGKSAKDAPTAEDLAQIVLFVRKALVDLYGRKAAESVPILYGGSVEPTNAGDLARETGVRGFLVGHASLKAKSLEVIAKSLLSK